MTTGRINQVCSVARRAPPPGVRAGGRAPMRALAPPGPALRFAPLRFIGGHAASARSRWLWTPRRVSPRLGGACLRPGQGSSWSSPRGRSLASPRPAPCSPGWPASPPAWPRAGPPRASWVGTRPRPRRLRMPECLSPHLGTVRLRTATRTKAYDPSATDSVLPLGWPPPRKDTSRLRGLTPRARLDATAQRRQNTDAPRCPGHRQRHCHCALCVLTRRGCPILYVLAQWAPAKTEALLPSRFREGISTNPGDIQGIPIQAVII